jgi:hypothetical protein
MIKIIKLITGEELIGDVSFIDSQYIIDQPCAIQLMPSRNDPSKTMMGLIPYASYTEDFKVSVKESMIVWQETPSSEIYNQYNTAFGSGIQLAGL